MTTVTKTPVRELTITWPLLPDDFELPDDPVEDESQPLLAGALRNPLTALPELMQDAIVVSNFALCAGVSWKSANGDETSIICKAPDWMYIRPVKPWNRPEPRRSYSPHTEGIIPQVVMEFLSKNQGEEYAKEVKDHHIGKWYFYEQIIEVPVYVIFSGSTGKLEVYHLKSEGYTIQEADANGRYLIPGLDLFLGVWEGTHERRTGYWLRWWNAQGELLLWDKERSEQERQQKEQERQRADRERQQADQERQRADQASQQAEQERQRAEQERERAEQERERAEQERERAEQERERAEQASQLAEQERQRAEALAERLRQLGIDLDESS